MTAALVVREKSQSTALERVQKALKNDLNNPGALIRAVLPNLDLLRGLGLPGMKPNPNVIRVNLDTKSVSPGDIIRGTLKLMISEPVPVHKVSIQVWGRSITYSGLWNSWGARVPFESFFTLADKTIPIDVGVNVLAPKIYEFPFETELPRTVTITKEDWPFDENTKRFNDNFTQPLPPTFQAYSTAHAHVDCSIKYFVIASLTSNQEKQDIVHKAPLIVKISDSHALMGTSTSSTSYMKCPFNFKFTSDVDSVTGPIVIETGEASRGTSITSIQDSVAPLRPESPLSPGSASKRLKLKNLAKDNLLRFRLPEYCFDLDAEIPRGGRISEVLPIVLKLGWHPPKAKKLFDRPPPATTLTAMRVELQSRFMTRGTTKENYNNYSFSAVAKTATWHCVWRTERIVISELKDPIELGPTTDVTKLMFVHPHKFLPAFRTFSIGREFVLTLVCDLTCAGERFMATYEVENFNVLAEGDGIEDDFLKQKPKLHRRPAATFNYAAEDDVFEGVAEASDSDSSHDGDGMGAEDELFKRDGKTPSHKVTVEELKD